ncbi:uncharacterized protein METZ01_LOCUS150261, partial [marine metagenome]
IPSEVSSNILRLPSQTLHSKQVHASTCTFPF